MVHHSSDGVPVGSPWVPMAPHGPHESPWAWASMGSPMVPIVFSWATSSSQWGPSWGSHGPQCVLQGVPMAPWSPNVPHVPNGPHDPQSVFYFIPPPDLPLQPPHPLPQTIEASGFRIKPPTQKMYIILTPILVYQGPHTMILYDATVLRYYDIMIL